MRQIWITKAGAPEVLQVREAPDPTAQPGEVRIRVKGAGINFADLNARMGIYPGMPKIPCVIGYEVAGVIDQIGDGVTDLAVGDRVFGMPRFGGYTDTLVLPSGQVFRVPAKMSFEEAAALPVVYLTAHHILFFTGNLRPRSKVLIHSAAGGVGLAAIQLARTRDCELFGTASPSKHDYLRSVGCQHPIDSGGDVAAAVRAIAGERGLDLVLDAVGGRSWREGFDLLGPAGRLVCFGFSTATTGPTRNLLAVLGGFLRTPRWSPLALMNANKQVAGVNMAAFFDRLDLLRPQFEALLALYEAGKIAPTVDRTFRFDEAAAAHQYLHDRKAKGKVILIP
jgi:NADPH:quinone reductase-like Zn-dependent oxidoreductase